MSVVNLAVASPPRDLLVDVCVIGSGAGGAVAADELSRAGLHVVVLEEGGDYPGEKLTQRDGEMYDQLYMERGGRSTTDLGISVLQGRVLGGGTVINASDVVPIADPVLEHWGRRFGLTDLSPPSLAPFRDEALRDLSANVPSEEKLNRNNRLLREGASSLGWSHEVMHHNRVGCAGAGTCLIGCPIDAKRNARTVILPRVLARGVEVFVRARATRIEDAGAELKTIRGVALDEQGHHEGAPFSLRARHVVLAANAVATAELLLRSGIGNAHIGRHLMLQPQLPITALFDDEVRFFRGIPQSVAVTEHEEAATSERGWWGFRIEAISGTPGIVASLLPSLGHLGKAWMAGYANMAASLLLLPDAPQGRVRVERNGRLRIDYALVEEQVARFRRAAKAAARVYLAAGAREVLVPTVPAVIVKSERDLALIDELRFLPATTPFLSAHQMGSVRFSTSEREGGAKPSGEVWGTRGVYAFDSSGYPSSAASHTMAPIMTTARMLARRLASEAKS